MAWRHVMARLGHVDDATAAIVERYSLSLARSRRAERELAAHGDVLTARKTGVKMISPWLSIARAASAECSRHERALKLSPASNGAGEDGLRPYRPGELEHDLAALKWPGGEGNA